MLARGPFDLAAFYRRVLAAANQPALVRGALLGLGESGTLDDVACVVLFLSADWLRVRCAALRARADSEPLSATEPYSRGLAVGRARHVAGGAPRARAASVSRRRRAPTRDLSSTRRSCRTRAATPSHLAYSKSKWERLAVLLDGCADPDEMIANMALRLVDGWCAGYNRSFLQPTPAQVEAASACVRPRLATAPSAGTRGGRAHLERSRARVGPGSRPRDYVRGAHE